MTRRGLVTMDYYDTLYQQRGATAAFWIAADDARKLRARSPTPRFIILREGEQWVVGRHVATVNEVPVYSPIDATFEVISDATAWVAAQEGAGHD